MKQEFAVVQFLKDAKRGSPVLWRSSVAMAIGMVLCFALPVIDARLIAGVSVWEKPAKFFLSLMVQAMTIAWAISLIPQYARRLKSATWIFVFAAWFEMSYMIFRASRGEASHFNQTSSLAIVMYALMGVGAVSLMVTSAFVGWRVWQQRGASLMREAIGLGLMFGAFLGTIAGAYLSSHTSHWIGGDQTDASGLAFFHSAQQVAQIVWRAIPQNAPRANHHPWLTNGKTPARWHRFDPHQSNGWCGLKDRLRQ